jgi:pimeloyl-ACP methyl ester carboxylesterase
MGNVHLAYAAWGTPPADRVVVCVHGLTRNKRDFDPLARHLAGRGAYVLAIDVAGRGQSDWLPDSAGYAIPTYAALILTLLADLAIVRVDWIGTSMGGLIGMAIAAMPGNPIERLVLNDVGPAIPAAALGSIAAYVGADPHFVDLGEAEAYLRRVHRGFGQLTAEQWAHLASHGVRVDPAGGWRLNYDPAIGDAFRSAPLTDIDLWPLWAQLTCRRLMIRGAESGLLPADVLARCLEDGMTDGIVFPECGHAPALMDARQIEAVAGWLGQPALSSRIG